MSTFTGEALVKASLSGFVPLSAVRLMEQETALAAFAAWEATTPTQQSTALVLQLLQDAVADEEEEDDDEDGTSSDERWDPDAKASMASILAKVDIPEDMRMAVLYDYDIRAALAAVEKYVNSSVP